MGVAMGDFGALIRRIECDTNSNVLPQHRQLPPLITKKRRFIVGDEVSYSDGLNRQLEQCNPFQTVERKEVGVKLKVVPQINEGCG